MKVLFSCPVPFMLAHGGAQIQIEQTKAALQEIGVEVDFLRWWDPTQRGDILQIFGRPAFNHVQLAQSKGIKVAFLDLLTQQGSRPPFNQWMHRVAIQAMRGALPPQRAGMLCSNAYLLADACMANTPWEAHLMSYVFGAPEGRVHVIPNGVEEVFLKSEPCSRGKWMVCTATITPRKRVTELAQAAVKAQTPLWVIGKPYSETDPYFQSFSKLVAQYPDLLRYSGPITDRAVLARTYREARGFVLLSTMETRSLSAEEAAACECPLLLSDLPWARSTFGDSARYCPAVGSAEKTANVLRQFYAEAPHLPAPAKPKSWIQVAEEFRAVYEALLENRNAAIPR